MRLVLLVCALAAAFGVARAFIPSQEDLDREAASRMLALPAQECLRAVQGRDPGAIVIIESEQRPGPNLVVVEMRAGERQYACSAVWTSEGRSVPFVSQR